MAEPTAGHRPAYDVRPARPDDVDFLTDVVIATTPDRHRPASERMAAWRRDFARWTVEQLAPGESTTSVIEVEGAPVGRLRVVRTATHLELAGLQLLPAAQRHGLGTAIIRDLQAEAAAAGLPLEIGVARDNPDARRLYERLGARLVGAGGDEDRLRWRP